MEGRVGGGEALGVADPEKICNFQKPSFPTLTSLTSVAPKRRRISDSSSDSGNSTNSASDESSVARCPFQQSVSDSKFSDNFFKLPPYTLTRFDLTTHSSGLPRLQAETIPLGLGARASFRIIVFWGDWVKLSCFTPIIPHYEPGRSLPMGDSGGTVAEFRPIPKNCYPKILLAKAQKKRL
jgi:hypothetical protein